MTDRARSRVLAAASALATLVALEVGLRLRDAVRRPRLAADEARTDETTLRLHRIVDDPNLGYEPRPGAVVERDGTVYRVNAQGLRGDGDVAAKRPGERRLVILGDSVAFGFGVDEPATFPVLLQRRLAARERGLRILNLAVLGYRTGQEVRRLERDGWALEPDGVVIAFCLNDFDDYAGGPPSPDRRVTFGFRWQAPRRMAGLELPDPTPVLDRSRLFRVLSGPFRVDYYAWVAADPDRRAKVARAFARLGQDLASRGVPGLVAIFPVLVDGATYPYAEVHRFVADAARHAGLEVVDLREVFPAGDLGALRLAADDVLHLNARGHAFTAEALASCLADARLRCT
jgi:lysophospholipase L1-like esterase